jgi:hypothetical protein
MRRLLLLLLALTPATTSAQIVTGFVIDSTTRQAIVNATVTVRTARDMRVVASALSDSTGQFRIRLPRPDTILVNARRIGFQPIGTPPHFVPLEGTLTLAFEMGRVAQLLDTMRTEGRRSLTGRLFRLTSGQEWYTRHLRAGKGFFTSSTEILLSGLSACDYLGRVTGLKVVPTAGALPSLACFDGTRQDDGLRADDLASNIPTRFVVPADRKVTCMQAFVDKKYRLTSMNQSQMAVAIPGERYPRWIPLSQIRGIEVYMNYEDRPEDFSIPPMKPIGRSIGTPNPNQSTVAMAGLDSRYCAVLLLWTAKYWTR